MKKYYKKRINSICFHLSAVLSIGGVVLLLPIVAGIVWEENFITSPFLVAYLIPGLITVLLGIILKQVSRPGPLSLRDSMFICTLSWTILSLIGAIPFTIILHISYLDAFFETMSGFTTTGITMLTDIETIPRSLLFWRALTQWIGGLGILSMFILLGFKGGAAANKVFSAESHKVSLKKPFSGIYRTAKVLWTLYITFTIIETVILCLLGLNFFDALTHAFTTIATGGYSIYDDSIAHFRVAGYTHAHLIEMVILLFMLFGSINFFVHFRFWTGNIKAVKDNSEIRYFWFLLAGAVMLIFINCPPDFGWTYTDFNGARTVGFNALLLNLKDIAFQVVSILTTTGYATRDIGSAFFTPIAKQLFLIFMVIGGCAGSTGGGFKVLRITILTRLIGNRLFRLNASRYSRIPLTVDGEIIDEKEIQSVLTLFFLWVLLIIIGGMITAVFSPHNGWQSFSGMFSALGNIGPCYLSVEEIILLPPVVKLTYIFGMLAGRLEILPVILLFSRKFYK
ncbi:MAG: TrkH family potassium uptake protein [bacterium]